MRVYALANLSAARNGVTDAALVLNYIAVPETNDLPAAGFQYFGAFSICIGAFGMLSAIQLDH